MFPADLPLLINDFTKGWWWLVHRIGHSGANTECVGFCGLVTQCFGRGFLAKAGVRVSARGHGLQRRMIRTREALARRQGLTRMLTYTGWDNIHSSNNLIRAGYRLYVPGCAEAKEGWLYWYKDL